MVRGEALLVSAVGIPLGVVAGIAGIGVALAVTGDSFFYLYSGETPLQLHVSWTAAAIAVLTALLTVLISAWIPARRAAKVNPIEAIRQTKDIRVGKQVVKKGKLSKKLFGLGGLLAAKQFARNKRQYRATVCSLFISIVLFISASSFSAYLRSSFDTANKTPEYDILVHIYGEASEYGKIIDKISSLDSVDRVYRFWELPGAVLVKGEELQEEYREMFVREELERGRLESSDEELSVDARLLVLSDEDYLQYLGEQGLAAEEYANPKEIRVPVISHVRSWSSPDEKLRNYGILKEEMGEVRVKLNNYKENSDAEVKLAYGTRVGKAPLDIYAGWGGGLCFILSKSMCEELLAPTGNELSVYETGQNVYVLAQNHQKATDEIEELALIGGWYSELYVSDVAQDEASAKNLLLAVDVFTYGFIVLISLIAAANVFHTISTGFLLRKKEFAVLSSAGMGPKTMNRMVNYECLLYGCKSLLYGLPVSILVTWWIYRVIEDSMDTKFLYLLTVS